MEKEVANYSTYKAAEEKLNAALEEIDSIKNDIKDFKYTGYGDKSAVSALRGKVTALQTKYGDDILSDADLKNLTDAEAAVKATGDKVDAVVVEIDKLPTSLNPLATVDSAVQAAKKSVEALVKEGVVPDTDISNYSDLVTLSEKVDAAKGEVDTLKADIAGFTYTGYGDKAEVEKLNDRLNALKAAYGDGILTDAELKNLTDAENAVEQTNNEIDAAVALINAKTATPLNPLSEAESALKDLHTAVDALADKGVDIENEISNYKKFADFEKTVNDASDAVKAAADEVAAFKYTGYGDKDAVAALRKKVDDLNKQYGDVLIRMNESLLDYYSKHNNSLEGFKIYYVNEGTGKLEVMRDASGNPKTLSVEVVDGVYFAVTSIDHCSSYLLTPEDLNEAISGLTKILLNAGAPLTLDELTQPDGAVLRLLSHMEPGVTLNKLAQYLSGGSMTVLDTNGNKVGADAPLGTGYTIGLGADGKTGGVTVAVAGDLNGDGSVDTKDLTMMRQAILQIGQLTQVQLKAATPSTNGSRVDTNDLVLLRRYLLSMTKTMLD